LRIALGDGPEVFTEREEREAQELSELGVRVLTLRDEDYPQRLRTDEGAPLVLQVAGRASLLEEEGVDYLAGYRGAAGARLAEVLDSGGRAVVVVSKGLLKADSVLRALHEPIEDGSVALLSMEPPRASWGPVRDKRRDKLCSRLREST